MGGPNLEVFKFGMYIMFPIGIMYYFGTNLDEKFAVPDFWPKKEETHKIPYDRKEIEEELERLKARRLAARARRLDMQGTQAQADYSEGSKAPSPLRQSLQHQEQSTQGSTDTAGSTSRGWLSWGR